MGRSSSRLEGVIDLRGKTSVRQLVRLVHHAQGVLCPVTGLMHLAAAVPTRGDRPPNRPCVVIAGGREPVHWEAYRISSSFIPLAPSLAAWMAAVVKDRTFRLRDGDKRDNQPNLCVEVAKDLPRCMDMISAGEVIRRIELYFQGGGIRYLRAASRRAPGAASGRRREIHTIANR